MYAATLLSHGTSLTTMRVILFGSGHASMAEIDLHSQFYCVATRKELKERRMPERR
jgi:hypothetical protein